MLFTAHVTLRACWVANFACLGIGVNELDDPDCWENGDQGLRFVASHPFAKSAKG